MTFKKNMKRKIALFLSTVLMMQTVFTGTAGAVEKTEQDDSGTYSYDMAEKGNPKGLFDVLDMNFNEKVSNDGSSYGLNLRGILSDDYMDEVYNAFLNTEGAMTEDQWKENPKGFDNYDQYLNAQPYFTDKGQAGTFTIGFNFPEGLFDSGVDTTILKLENTDTRIGEYKLEVKGKKATLTVKLDNMVYGHPNVRFGIGLEGSLEYVYKSDTVVTVKPGTENDDFTIRIPESGIEKPENTDYRITKKGEADKDKRTVTYKITATAASASNASPSAATDDDVDEESASESEPRDPDRALDPEEDDDWTDDGGNTSYEGPGLTAVIDALVPDQYQRLESGNIGGEENDLTGKVISDKLPADLDLISVTRVIDGSETILSEVTDPLENGYTLTDGVLRYVIRGETDDAVGSVTLLIVMKVSNEKYNDYMLHPSDAEWKFPNKVLLKGSEDELLDISDTVEPVINLKNPYSKEGYPIRASGGKIGWTVKVNSYFSNSGVRLYAIDHIQDVENTHNYVTGDDSVVKIDGTEENIYKVQDLLDGATYSYDKITAVSSEDGDKVSIDSLLLEISDQAADGEKPGETDVIVYEYENPVSMKKDAVMLIPLSAETNRQIEITYETQTIIDFNNPDTLQKDLSNGVKLLWQWPEGEGPGNGDENFGTASVEKKLPVDYSLVKKTAKSNGPAYDLKTNTLTWEFEINSMGVEAAELKIVDVLNDEQQLLTVPEAGADKKLILKSQEAGVPDKEVPYSETSDSTEAYYMITKTGEEGKGSTILTVYLPEMEANEHYKFEVKTFVTTQGAFNGTSESVSNKATITAKIGDIPVTIETEASSDILNTLIQKQAIPFNGDETPTNQNMYNYKDNTVTWRITINPNSLSIKNGLITDSLPNGTHFADLTRVYYGSDVVKNVNYIPEDTVDTVNEASESAAKWTEDGPPAGTWVAETNDSKHKITVKQEDINSPLLFTFLSAEGGTEDVIDRPVTFEFTTHVRKELRQSFKSNQSNTLDNKAKLEGIVVFTNGEFKAETETSANNIYMPSPIVKSGQYLATKEIAIDENITKIPAIEWEIYVNRTGTDMTGAVLKDEMKEIMELLPSYMQVYVVELNEKGIETGIPVPVFNGGDSAADAKKAGFTQLDSSGFTYAIPPDLGQKTLKFVFTTIFVDDADASEMTNKISINIGDWMDSTEEIKAENAKRFRLGDYASAGNLYYAKIHKTSENKESGSFPLPGAEFEIRPMTLADQSASTTDFTNWKVDGSKKSKTRVSNKGGNVNFMFLQPDTLYEIVETKAPDGYVLKDENAFRWYVVPKLIKTSREFYPVSDSDESTAVPKRIVYVNEGGDNYQIFEVKNTPSKLDGSSLSFTKQGQNGQILPDVTFTARFGNKLSATAVSDKDGKVTFERLDYLDRGKYYTITEETPTGYNPKNLSLKAEVYWDEQKQQLVAGFIDAEATLPEGILSNEPISRTGSFKKVDQNGDPLLNSGVKFKVERRGDGGNLLTTENETPIKVCVDVDDDRRMQQTPAAGDEAQSARTYYQYRPSPSVTADADGIVKLENFLYGDYKLTETDFPYNALSKTPAVVYVRVDKTGIYAGKEAFDMNALGNWSGTSIAGANSFTVSNELQYGLIALQKIIGEKNETGTVIAAKDTQGNTIPMSGVEFNLYRVSGKKETFVITLTTGLDGKLPAPDQNGGYTGTDQTNSNVIKQLVTGSYILRESRPSGYYAAQDIRFEIKTRESTENFIPEQIYIGSSGNVTKPEDALVYNLPQRGTIELTKKDAGKETLLLSGAEFKVYTKKDDKYVADLMDTDKDGKYTLVQPGDSGGSKKTIYDGIGRKYLNLEKEKNSEGTVLRLLYGDYVIKETKAPGENYVTVDPDKFKVDVTVKDYAQPYEVAQVNFKNSLITQSVKVKKRIEVRKPATASSLETVFEDYADGVGFEFTLLKDNAHSGPINGQDFPDKKGTTKKDGQAVVFTDIPVGTYLLKETRIPEKYGTMDNPYIELMPDITVNVTKDGVSYQFAATPGNSIPSTPEPETEGSKVTLTPDSTNKNPTLVAYNNYLLGSANSTKVGVWKAASANTVPLSGVKFTLKNVNAGISMDLTSDEKGEIAVKNIPYGIYQLTETLAPEGYAPLAAPITFTVDKEHSAVQIQSAGRTDGKIENILRLKSLRFAKVDQNGEALGSGRTANIVFDITREKDQVVLPEDYVLPTAMRPDADGFVTIPDLPYGTYNVTEKTIKDDPVLSDSEGISFSISITKETSGTLISLTPVKPAADDKYKAVSLSKNHDDSDAYDFTSNFRLVNSLKHGDIRISKLQAESDSDSINDMGKAMKGVAFNIYRDTGNVPADDAVPYLVLKTGANGNFDSNDGWYVDARDDKGGTKQIPLGDYYYKEEVPKGYRLPDTDNQYVNFNIADSSTDEVTEFTHDGNGKPTASIVKETAEPSAFYNVVKRGIISLSKKDSDATKPLLSGAEFAVYSDEAATEQVATLKESKTNGVYILDGTGFENKRDDKDLLYLYKDDADVWKLLEGNYWIVETKAPEGYNIPSATKISVTVTDQENSEVDFINTLDPVDVKFLKVDQNGDAVKANVGNRKLDFKIERISSGASENETALDARAKGLLPSDGIISTDDNGIVTVLNLISGKYKLTEQIPATPAKNWISDKAVIYITVEQQTGKTPRITFSTSAGAPGDWIDSIKADGSVENPLCDLTTEKYKDHYVKNTLKYGLVDIKKVAADDNADGSLKPLEKTPLAGVVFAVYEDNGTDPNVITNETGKKVLEMVTGTDGRFKLGADKKYLDKDNNLQDYRLVYGKTYWIHEELLPENLSLDYNLDRNYYSFIIGDEIVNDTGLITYYVGTAEQDNVTLPGSIANKNIFGQAGEALLFPNGPLFRAPVSLSKTDSATGNPVTGAKFSVYDSTVPVKVAELADNSDGIYKLVPGTGSQKENSSGQEYLKQTGTEVDKVYKLLGGSYYIKETKAPSGYITPADTPENYWYFKVSSHNEIGNAGLEAKDGSAVKPFTNSHWERDIVVEKQIENFLPGQFHTAGAADDIFTFELSGTTSNGMDFETRTEQVITSSADAGKAIFTAVPAGTYRIKEILTGDAKQGGKLADVYIAPEEISVKVDENGVFYDNSSTAAGQAVAKNLLKRGTVTGAKFTKDMTGEVALAGAEFELKPVAPVRTEVLTATSDSKGQFVFKNVPLGRYELRETKAPAGYELSSAVMTVEVKTENANVTIDQSGGQIKFMNKGVSTLTVEKLAEFIENNNIAGVMHPGQGFLFKITGTTADGAAIETFVKESDITGADQIEIRANGNADDGVYVTTGVAGKVTVKNLPVGNYVVQEQENEKNNMSGIYTLDAREREANITIDHGNGKVSASMVKVDNHLKRGQIQGVKTNSGKQPLAGAEIGLFPAGTTEFKEGNLWCGQKVTTGDDGIYLFNNIPCGTYLIAEIKAPGGYNLNSTTRYEVTVTGETLKTTGFLLEGSLAKPAEETAIVIINTKKSSGGGGGGETKPPATTAPGETNPSESNTGESGTGETRPTLPVESSPNGGTDVTVPPDTPPGTDVEVKDPNGDTVFNGKTDDNGKIHVDLPPGEYTLITLDENQVPLASMTFIIEDGDVPLAALAAPDAGDHSVPVVVLAIVMLSSLAGMILVSRKKREDKKKSQGNE